MPNLGTVSSSQQLATTFFMNIDKENTKMGKTLKDYIVTSIHAQYTKIKIHGFSNVKGYKAEEDNRVLETYVRTTSKRKAYEYVSGFGDVERLICVKKVNKANKPKEITIESLRDFAESYARKEPTSVVLVNRANAGFIHKWVVEAYLFADEDSVDPYDSNSDFCPYSVECGKYAVAFLGKLVFKLPEEYIKWSTTQNRTSLSWSELLDILNNIILKRDSVARNR